MSEEKAYPFPIHQQFTIPAGKMVKVTIPEFQTFSVTSISTTKLDEGRTVVWISTVDNAGKESAKIAIAPLTIGQLENRNVDFEFNSYSDYVFSTTGTKISVNVIGYTPTTSRLIIKEI